MTDRQQPDPGPGQGRIRVTHVLEATTGGTARQLRELVTGINRDTFDLSVICSLGRDPGFAQTVARFRAIGIPVAIVPMQRTPQVLADTRALRAIRRCLREWRPHILHTHSAKAGFLGRIAARGFPAKTVYTPHGLPFQMRTSTARHRLYRSLEALATRWTDATICVSEEEMQLATGLRANPPPSVLIPNGVDIPDAVDRTAARQRLLEAAGLSAGNLVVGAVGRLAEQKGFAFLVDAAEQVCERVPEARFVLIGDGRERDALAAGISDGGNADRIHLLGARDDAAELIAGMDVLAMPSLWEGLPYSLLDSLGRGTPVVASRVGGIPDVIRNGSTGVLVPPADATALAEALAGLLQDAPRRQALGSAGQELVQKTFSRREMIDKTESLYRRVVKKERRLRKTPGQNSSC